MTKLEMQDSNFYKLISLNLPHIQARHIAMQLAEKSILNFKTELKNSILKIYSDKGNFKIELLEIDIPVNKLETI